MAFDPAREAEPNPEELQAYWQTVRRDVPAAAGAPLAGTFAADEGEGDLSLAYWREAHRNFFGRVCARLGLDFSERIEVVAERFRVMHRADDDDRGDHHASPAG